MEALVGRWMANEGPVGGSWCAVWATRRNGAVRTGLDGDVAASLCCEKFVHDSIRCLRFQHCQSVGLCQFICVRFRQITYVEIYAKNRPND